MIVLSTTIIARRTTAFCLRPRPPSNLCSCTITPLRQFFFSPKFWIGSPATTMATIDLSNYDVEQAKLMKEQCILVNENDQSLGPVDKKDCELSQSLCF